MNPILQTILQSSSFSALYNKYLKPFLTCPLSLSPLSSLLFNLTRCTRKKQHITIDKPFVAMQIAYEWRYVGPQAVGQTYEPAMLPSCEKALMKAMATARFAGGRGRELEHQAKKVTKPL